jgi:DNA-directed RNA polymerase subunit RPC12/RpoP
MVRCPNCGSTAQVRKYDWDIHFDSENEITINRQYLCKGCGHLFSTDQLYKADGEEIVNDEEDE